MIYVSGRNPAALAAIPAIGSMRAAAERVGWRRRDRLSFSPGYATTLR
jgi:hypothetical protein